LPSVSWKGKCVNGWVMYIECDLRHRLWVIRIVNRNEQSNPLLGAYIYMYVHTHTHTKLQTWRHTSCYGWLNSLSETALQSL
jgi:hypothetical protein